MYKGNPFHRIILCNLLYGLHIWDRGSFHVNVHAHSLHLACMCVCVNATIILDLYILLIENIMDFLYAIDTEIPNNLLSHITLCSCYICHLYRVY